MNKRIPIVIALLPFIASGCGLIQFNTASNSPQAPTAGIYKSINAGATWQQNGLIYQVQGSPQVITYNALSAIKEDPQDPNTLYLATDTGLYYTYNRGDGWFRTLAGEGVVNDIAVDPRTKCTLYAAAHNKLFKSTDCARTWLNIHFSSLSGEFFKSVMVSRADSNIIYIGTSVGTLLESANGGHSWQVKRYFDSSINRFIQSQFDDNLFYIVTPKVGIQRTKDNGTTWEALNSLPVYNPSGEQRFDSKNNPVVLKDLSGSNAFIDAKFDSSQEEGLIYASGYGIFRLVNGEYWQSIKILNKPSQQKIYSIAIDGSTGQNLFFGTPGAFYQSVNAGKEWTVQRMPATGIPKFLHLMSDNNSELFVGFIAPAK